MPRYALRFGNTTNNPAESIDMSGDTADPFVFSLENPQGSGAVVWGLQPGGLTSGSVVQVTTNAGAITTGATLTPNISKWTIIRCQPAGAVTGIILANGSFDSQEVDVVNESVAANTITFAAAGTSHVADGATTAIAGVTARRLIWNAATSLWYKVGG